MNINFPYLKYFIECYFNWSMDYVDLNQLAAEYLKIENEKHILTFKKEIEKLQTLSNSSEMMKEMVYNYGNRVLSLEKSKEMLNILIRNFL
jgi:hypothetical protein